MENRKRVLTDNGNQRLRALLRDNNVPAPVSQQVLAMTFPLLGEAGATVMKFDKLNVSLYANKPGALETSGETRECYALADIDVDELVKVEYHIGKASGGYWAASPIGSSSTTSPNDTEYPEGCAPCDTIALIQTIVDKLAAADTLDDDTIEEIQTEIDELKTACSCAKPGIACSLCAEGEVPAEVDVSIANVEYIAWREILGFPRNGPLVNYDDWSLNLMEGINKTHRIQMQCGGGFVEFESQGRDRLGNELTYRHRIEIEGPTGQANFTTFPATWVVRIYVDRQAYEQNTGDGQVVTFRGENHEMQCSETYENFEEVPKILLNHEYAYLNPFSTFIRVEPVG